jgi:tetratricopeptide (TPR) repeat protein
LGELHPSTATSLNNLASLYQAQGKYEQAEPLYERALAIYTQAFGLQHPGTKTIQENYALFLEEKHRKRS